MEDFTFKDRPGNERLAQSLENISTISPDIARLYIDLQWTYLGMQKEYEAVLKQHDLSESRFIILMFLSHATDWVLTPSEIATKLGATRATVSKLLKAMEQKGLVSKTHSASDKRSSEIKLTTKGNETLTNFLPDNFKAVEVLTSYLSTEDIAQLFKLLDKLKLGTQKLHNEME